MSLTLSVSKTLPKLASKKLLKKAAPTANEAQTYCLAVLVDDETNLIGNFKGLEAYQQRIENLIAVSDFKGKLGETVTDFALSADAKKAPLQLLLVGIGKPEKTNPASLRKIATALYKNTHNRVTNLAVAIGEDLAEESLQQLALELLNASYRFDKYKSETTEPKLTEVTLISSSVPQSAIDYVTAVHSGQSLARDVANEPGNICFPEYMADQAKALAETYPDLLKVTVLGEREMEALGMNCFLSVSRGSVREGQLVILEYQGKNQATTTVSPTSSSFADTLANNLKVVADKLPKKAAKASKANSKVTEDTAVDAPIVLVGKGVTFDSGGISIKPGAAMDEMKFDMGGSASVLGTIKALCEARMPINVVGALACAENMPSGEATRPGDIVKAMNGMNVEILNTDAEGRLVLADTLCYVQRYNPRAIIDVATLTGACVVALGHVRSAVFSNDEDVLFELENASDQTGDLIWHMPLDDDYQSLLDSPIADIQNIGGRSAGAVTAACFLSRFIKEGQAWAHLDIAGTAWNSGKEKAATGRPVPLFMQYLKNLSEQ
ncbi:leucyl aminopeptidase [Psychrobacter sanguinis]|uniref:leucyl aminopeptidase n=1 Tax=Psychrobacter sanguinis TaxID=861445 RepID=UPI00020C7A61|nr:leucyl aminopeptidase [Psychrobacter sanguinis]EGK13160.1 leucyl aminopeptidase [Psychrobacter sp. 1501(2011)]MCC3309000.1 leucyl aminopeptidase [Psychrobacter sanguinis]MCD9150287.1 leucyl aminopeptidase [Psychrobacter sanguinis]MDY3305549.1 leucyl aminopeptidase [Psychrobacter sanguinis]UEC26287.1 leucyl aminopeptidase [Psychrobacter sanguinis]